MGKLLPSYYWEETEHRVLMYLAGNVVVVGRGVIDRQSTSWVYVCSEPLSTVSINRAWIRQKPPAHWPIFSCDKQFILSPDTLNAVLEATHSRVKFSEWQFLYFKALSPVKLMISSIIISTGNFFKIKLGGIIFSFSWQLDILESFPDQFRVYRKDWWRSTYNYLINLPKFQTCYCKAYAHI